MHSSKCFATANLSYISSGGKQIPSVFNDVIAAAFQPSTSMTFFADAERILQNFNIAGVTATGITVNGEDILFIDAEEELGRAWSETKALPPEERVAATTQKLSQTQRTCSSLCSRTF